MGITIATVEEVREELFRAFEVVPATPELKSEYWKAGVKDSGWQSMGGYDIREVEGVQRIRFTFDGVIRHGDSLISLIVARINQLKDHVIASRKIDFFCEDQDVETDELSDTVFRFRIKGIVR